MMKSSSFTEGGRKLFDVLKKLGWFFKLHWKRYIFAIIALICASALGLFPPKLLGYTIDHIRFDTLTMQLLTVIIIVYISITIIDYIVSYLWNYNLFGGSVILEKTVRSQLMQHFLKMSPTFFGKYN